MMIEKIILYPTLVGGQVSSSHKVVEELNPDGQRNRRESQNQHKPEQQNLPSTEQHTGAYSSHAVVAEVPPAIGRLGESKRLDVVI